MKNHSQLCQWNEKWDWGHAFPKDKGEGMLTLNQFGKIHVSWGNPIKKCQLPFFLSFPPNHLFLSECGWGSYCMEGEEYGKIWIRQSTRFQMSYFSCMDKKTPEPYASLRGKTHAFMIWELQGTTSSFTHPFIFIHTLTIFILHSRGSSEQWSSSMYVSFAFCGRCLWKNTVTIVLQRGCNYRVYETSLLVS